MSQSLSFQYPELVLPKSLRGRVWGVGCPKMDEFGHASYGEGGVLGTASAAPACKGKRVICVFFFFFFLFFCVICVFFM